MHHLNPTYIFNSAEVIDEYNLLNTFLNRSLLEDESLHHPDRETVGLDSTIAQETKLQPKPSKNLSTNETKSVNFAGSLLPSCVATSGASTVSHLDKAQEKYYFTAADPAESGFPEERMNKLLKAKYEAGMLKPFNYVNGYARLNQYMEHNLHQRSRQRILRQLDGFRPDFRKRMQILTDMELVMVEVWFERSLMEYERTFAIMAIPACCWRRTGEVFRGNREMAELIHVDIDELREVCRYYFTFW